MMKVTKDILGGETGLMKKLRREKERAIEREKKRERKRE
jgi:hypothetical protein